MLHLIRHMVLKSLDRQIPIALISVNRFCKLGSNAANLPQQLRLVISYKPSVQQLQTSERKHIFQYTLIDCIFKMLIQKSEKTDAWFELPDRKLLLASLCCFPT